jgi:glycosyltransferase involved in cell wall biosynthesis
VGTYCRVLARGLADLGHHVTVVAPGGGLIPGARVVSLGPRLRGRSHAVWLTASRRYASVARQFRRFDVVHLADAREAFLYPKGECPTVGTVHDYYFSFGWKSGLSIKRYYRDWLGRYVYQRGVHLLEGISLRRLDLLMCNSDAVRERIASAYGLPRERIRVTYLAVPPSLRRQNDRGSHGPILLFAGGNFQRKGLAAVIRALPLLRTKWADMELRVAGADRSKSTMSRLASSLGVANCVRFLGWLPPEKMAREMSNASVFVMPSWEEGFGLVHLEAMQVGAPVIAGNVGGTKELISDRQNGFLVTSGDHRMLADTVAEVLQDRTLRAKVVQGGYETARRFSPPRLARATVHAYHAARR